MKESEALKVWTRLTNSQRAALLRGIPLGFEGDTKNQWTDLKPETQRELLKLDWSFMLGGKF